MTSTHVAIAVLFGIALIVRDVNAQWRVLPHDTLARFGLETITTRDLLERLELMPWPGKDILAQHDTMKVKALHALVAERLLALEARRLNIGEDATTQRMRRGLEQVFLRDELYRRDVVEKTRPTTDEIVVGMKRIVWNLKLMALLTPSKQSAETVVRSLRAATNRDSLLHTLPQDLVSKVDTIDVSFGHLSKEYEDAAYNIGKTRISKAVASRESGWVVFYMLDRRPNPEMERMNVGDRLRRVERLLEARNEAIAGPQYYLQVLKPRKAYADSNVLHLFAESVLSLWKADTASFRAANGYMITPDLVDILFHRLAAHIDTPFVRYNQGILTLGDILEQMRYVNVVSPTLDAWLFELRLNEAVKEIVGTELLAEEARKQNLQQTEQVRHDMALWTDHWLARALYYHILDTVGVSEEEVVAHLVKNVSVFGNRYEVNVREVLTPNLDEASAILIALQAGEPLSRIARSKSKRTEWAARDGESGFFPLQQHPDLGFWALLSDTGKLVGPTKLPEGYSIFVVLGKRKTADAFADPDTLKKNVLARLLEEQRKRTLDRFIANLARQQGLAIDYAKLKAVHVTSTNMFTRRRIGFGGVMTAVPMLMQQWEWINEFNEQKKLIP